MNWKVFWIVVICWTACYAIWTYLYQGEFVRLAKTLYQQGDADGYLKELESRRAKFFFPAEIRKLMQIDAYLAKQNQAQVNQLFAELNTSKLRTGDRITLLQKEIGCYADSGEGEKAEKAFQQLEQIFAQKKNLKDGEQVLQECRYVLAIKVERSGKYAEELEKCAATAKSRMQGGIYLYKAAQSYWLRGEMDKARQVLSDAAEKLKGTSYEKEIASFLADSEMKNLA